MTGFWGEELAVPQQVSLTTEVVNGKQYQAGLLKKVALFPTQSGTLEINPLEIVCQVQMQNRKRSNDFFDQFFNDPFFNNVATSNVNIKSAAVKITVLPLPKTDVPASFKGAVGKFNLNASVSSTTVKTNEPLSLKATIGGSGNIKILEAPNIEISNDFEKYDPKVNENDRPERQRRQRFEDVRVAARSSLPRAKKDPASGVFIFRPFERKIRRAQIRRH